MQTERQTDVLIYFQLRNRGSSRSEQISDYEYGSEYGSDSDARSSDNSVDVDIDSIDSINSIECEQQQDGF